MSRIHPQAFQIILKVLKAEKASQKKGIGFVGDIANSHKAEEPESEIEEETEE